MIHISYMMSHEYTLNLIHFSVVGLFGLHFWGKKVSLLLLLTSFYITLDLCLD